MSILQQVIAQYGISGLCDASTDKTDKRSSVTYVSEWSELLENKNGELELQELQSTSKLVDIIHMRKRGKTPAHYTATTKCKHCGLVPIWEGCPSEVLGCPWCFNRLKGLPIPK